MVLVTVGELGGRKVAVVVVVVVLVLVLMGDENPAGGLRRWTVLMFTWDFEALETVGGVS